MRSRIELIRLSREAWELSLELKALEKSEQYAFARAVVGDKYPKATPRQLRRLAWKAVKTARNTKREDWGWISLDGRRYFVGFSFIYGADGILF